MSAHDELPQTSLTFLGNAPDSRTIPEAVVIGMTLSIIVLATIIGNLFVILAVIVDKDLRRPQYILILSLAVADTLVGCAVTPIATVYELQKRWTLGAFVCDFWTSCDVLVAIALDRYWSVTDVTYMQRRTAKRILSMLAVVWIVSLSLSIAPIFGWKDDDYEERIDAGVCLLSQSVSYQIFSTLTAFYLPLFFIIFIYWRVFKVGFEKWTIEIAWQIQAAKRRFLRERQRKATTQLTASQQERLRNPMQAEITAANGTKLHVVLSNDSSMSADRARTPLANGTSTKLLQNESNTPNTLRTSQSVLHESNNTLELSITQSSGEKDNPEMEYSAIVPDDDEQKMNGSVAVKQDNPPPKKKKRSRPPKESAESKRERKAWRTLAIITGTFVMCWLPFFILALCRPLFSLQDSVPRPVEGFVNWLGYLNSAINPIIYTIFSPDFRMAFQKMLKRLIMWK